MWLKLQNPNELHELINKVEPIIIHNYDKQHILSSNAMFCIPICQSCLTLAQCNASKLFQMPISRSSLLLKSRGVNNPNWQWVPNLGMEGRKKKQRTATPLNYVQQHLSSHITPVWIPSLSWVFPFTMCSGPPSWSSWWASQAPWLLLHLAIFKSCHAERRFHPVSLPPKMLPGICTVNKFKLALFSESRDHLMIINSEPGNNGYEQTLHEMLVFSENRSPRNFQLEMAHRAKVVAPTLFRHPS